MIGEMAKPPLAAGCLSSPIQDLTGLENENEIEIGS